jgi:uncharacterized membrane protein YqjE
MATPGGAGPDQAAASAPSSTVRSTVRTLLSFAETRARLAANEFEEQVLRLLEVAAWAVAAVFFFAIAVLLVSLFIVLVFWDANRILAAGLLAGLFITGGGVSVMMVRSCLAARPKFLAATLAEFEKDRQKMAKP